MGRLQKSTRKDLRNKGEGNAEVGQSTGEEFLSQISRLPPETTEKEEEREEDCEQNY